MKAFSKLQKIPYNNAIQPTQAPPRFAWSADGGRWAPHMLKKELVSLAATAALLVIGVSYGAESEENNFRGVVTYQLIPAKVMRVNEIVKDPEPGTSYIGDKGILVELDRDMDVRANWTVVEIEYYEYEEPKTVQYELLGEEHEITVNYHAVSVVVDGDISEYIDK